MNKAALYIFSLIFTLFLISNAAGQNLIKENRYYQRAQELQNRARQAMEDGEYERATELSGEAKKLMSNAESFAEKQVRIYKARGWKKRAEKYIAWGKDIEAENRYPDQWEEAKSSYVEAESLFEQEKWDKSIDAARKTISIIEEMKPKSAYKPRYYVVRLIPEDRDCFWKIAEYDFVYDDPWKWRTLYEANKEKLPQPDNPSLILPGTKLKIPSLSGERREGLWNEDK